MDVQWLIISFPICLVAGSWFIWGERWRGAFVLLCVLALVLTPPTIPIWAVGWKLYAWIALYFLVLALFGRDIWTATPSTQRKK